MKKSEIVKKRRELTKLLGKHWGKPHSCEIIALIKEINRLERESEYSRVCSSGKR